MRRVYGQGLIVLLIYSRKGLFYDNKLLLKVRKNSDKFILKSGTTSNNKSETYTLTSKIEMNNIIKHLL
jgi:hypothetical protein